MGDAIVRESLRLACCDQRCQDPRVSRATALPSVRNSSGRPPGAVSGDYGVITGPSPARPPDVGCSGFLDTADDQRDGRPGHGVRTCRRSPAGRGPGRSGASVGSGRGRRHVSPPIARSANCAVAGQPRNSPPAPHRSPRSADRPPSWSQAGTAYRGGQHRGPSIDAVRRAAVDYQVRRLPPARGNPARATARGPTRHRARTADGCVANPTTCGSKSIRIA